MLIEYFFGALALIAGNKFLTIYSSVSLFITFDSFPSVGVIFTAAVFGAFGTTVASLTSLTSCTLILLPSAATLTIE